MTTKRLLLLLGALGAIGIVAFLALRASPWLGELPWIPGWLSAWADRNGNLRNFPAFAALAGMLTLALGWRLGGGVSAVFAIGLELAQVFIAERTFDWADIAWSLAGVASVVAPVSIWCRRKPPEPGR